MPDTSASIPAFVWKGKELRTIGEIGDALCALTSKREGTSFFKQYLAVTPHAGENIGYVAGYYDTETARRIWRFTGTAHPVFGTHRVSAKKAFEAGKRMGAELLGEKR